MTSDSDQVKPKKSGRIGLVQRTRFFFLLLFLLFQILGVAAFLYQRSLFDPNVFNARIIDRAVLNTAVFGRAGQSLTQELQVALSTDTLLSATGPLPEGLALFDQPMSKQGKEFSANLKAEISKTYETVAALRQQRREGRRIRRQQRLDNQRLDNQRRAGTNNTLRRNPTNFEPKVDVSRLKVDSNLALLTEHMVGQSVGEGVADNFELPTRRGLDRLAALRRPVFLVETHNRRGEAQRMLLLPRFANNGILWVLAGLYLAGSLLLALLAFFAVRRYANPLAKLANSARHFGNTLSPQPISTRGGPEISEAATAFNRMQTQVTGLVNERTSMIAAVSHDIRTMLTRLRLRTELLPQDGASQELVEKSIQDIDEMEMVLESSLEYSRHLLDSSTSQSPALRGDEEAEWGDKSAPSVDLNKVVQQLVEQMANSNNVALKPFHSELWVCGIEQDLKRCLMNLVDNAVKYGDRAELSVQKADHQALVIVQDHGPGIPPEERSKVIKPFERLEHSRSRQTGGVGLGLAIAHTIATKNGGGLLFGERDDGANGLKVTLTLPLVPKKIQKH